MYSSAKSYSCLPTLPPHQANDDTSKAIDCFEQVLKKDPENVDALKVLGSLYSSSHRSLALERLTKASEIEP